MTTSSREATDVNLSLGDRYRIERELGRGGMGAVFLARDLRLDRQVAIKVLPQEMASNAMLRERFLRETRTAAGFSHPNIVPVHAVEERPGLLAFVMGFIEGESLAQRVARTGPLEAREILRLLLDVAYALAYAHGRDVVHRDVKPDNVMLERATGRALLMDFGISRSVTTNAATPGVTRIGEVVGTPEYMSPEQSVGDQVDGRSDLYSLALTAYFAATGQPAFAGENTQKVLMQQLSESPPPLGSLRPDLPKVLVDAVDKCLQKDPADRFADAGELITALEGAQSFAPDVPMPIRLFTQELATLGMLVSFVIIFSWVITQSTEGRSDLDTYIPIVLIGSIVLGRFMQAFVDAKRMIRQGFQRTAIIDGMRSVLNEKEQRRIQLRSDEKTRRARRRTVLVSLGMVLMAMLLINFALNFRHQIGPQQYAVEPRGVVMFFSALVMLGFAFILLVRSPLRMPISERAFRLVWLGFPGRLFFYLASTGVDTPVASRRPVTVASTEANAKLQLVKPNGSAPSAESRLEDLEKRVSNIEQQLRR